MQSQVGTIISVFNICTFKTVFDDNVRSKIRDAEYCAKDITDAVSGINFGSINKSTHVFVTTPYKGYLGGDAPLRGEAIPEIQTE